METKKATISRNKDITELLLHVGDVPLKIILTEDNPKNVMATFNSLLKRLKEGLFEFVLEDDVQDLFMNISSEYITQLNSELTAVHKDLVNYELINDPE
ncbi:MAG: hypothetical protein JSS76_17810 [Bacteroidetes bacterium]|nr:hypothetical protein [Bacteroidota bacterium]